MQEKDTEQLLKMETDVNDSKRNTINVSNMIIVQRKSCYRRCGRYHKS